MAPEGAERPRTASRLAEASSLYLREAANQPIDWHPWGSEPFELARRSARPILLDIGASWCHWCHVMDEGTYADAEVAEILRQHFVTVKVDRDEHPEVDRRFQRQVGALSGEGGWPLTAFLTPDGDVFYGGTYFPPTDGHGRPGFRRLLKEIARLWSEEPDQVRHQATAVREAIARLGRAPPGSSPKLASFAEAVSRELLGGFDPAYGGFGTAPKFPHPTAVALLLGTEPGRGTTPARDAARETLLRMADGGMYDQLGGGFHRYSVDEGWHIPHFEKMGIDNAELLVAYVDGFRAFGTPRFEEIVRGTIGWADAVLGDPQGGWGASQDADNAPGDDGSYFTWSRGELREALDAQESRLVSRVFGVGTDGRMPHDPERNVLFRLLPVAEAAEGLALDAAPEQVFRRASEKLRLARERRPAPRVDRAVYGSITGRFLAAYAGAAGVFGEADWLSTACRAADRWLAQGYRGDRGVAHLLGPAGGTGLGLLDDQVSFARGLIELAVAAGRASYLAPARELLELVDREFRGEDGLLRDVAPKLYDGAPVGGSTDASYPLEDSPHLSPNSAAALAWLRLASVTGDERWTEKARGLLAAIASRVGGAGLFAAGAALAAGLVETPTMTVVVEGSGPEADRLLLAARRAWHPRSVVWGGPERPPFELPSAAGIGAPAGPGVRALVCFASHCAPPVADPPALTRLIEESRPAAP